jgi:formate-dependent phosphoribosylglycinamide formyltransferase (GAR transformylase)
VSGAPDRVAATTSAAVAIAPGAWLGLLGGGQLGRMFCMAAQSLGYRVAVLDPGDDSPAGSVADRHLKADYLDPAALAALRAACSAATTEFENVPAAALEFLSRELRVTPSAASVAIAQDRVSEKTFLAGGGFAVAPFAVLRGRADAAAVDDALLPGIVKSARLGYDGKGQARVATRDDVGAAFDRLWASDLGIPNGLGRHDNDGMFSFYLQTPVGFQIEVGHGARVITDGWADDRRYDAISAWGHQPLRSA